MDDNSDIINFDLDYDNIIESLDNEPKLGNKVRIIEPKGMSGKTGFINSFAPDHSPWDYYVRLESGDDWPCLGYEIEVIYD